MKSIWWWWKYVKYGKIQSQQKWNKNEDWNDKVYTHKYWIDRAIWGRITQIAENIMSKVFFIVTRVALRIFQCIIAQLSVKWLWKSSMNTWYYFLMHKTLKLLSQPSLTISIHLMTKNRIKTWLELRESKLIGA